MTHPSWALQKAVYEVLNADGALMAMLAGDGIYDVPPQSASYPYLVLGQVTSTDRAIPIDEGSELRIVLSVWSRNEGKKEVLEISARVIDLLHDAALTLTNHTLINLRLVSQETAVARDRRSVATQLRFRAVTEPIL